ncbi:hypothetical protein [Arthrobacter crusticola]|nr:hypothetical protein [Arthrobacter crusticola]
MTYQPTNHAPDGVSPEAREANTTSLVLGIVGLILVVLGFLG